VPSYQQIIALAKSGHLTQAAFDNWVQNNNHITPDEMQNVADALKRTESKQTWVQQLLTQLKISPLGPQGVGQNVKQIPEAAAGWLGSIGGMLASGIEAGLVTFFKDLWNVILGPLEILAGILLAVAVLAIYFKEDIGAAAMMAAAA
jgi:hypothetical protein